MTEQYDELISSIRADVVETHGIMLSDVNYEIVMLYWRIGRKIILEGLDGEFDPGDFLERLQNELSDQSLYQKLSFKKRYVDAMLVFARDYPDEEFVEQFFTNLNWELTSVLLLEINGKRKRHWYATTAMLKQWSVSDLKKAINNSEFELRKLDVISDFDVGLVG